MDLLACLGSYFTRVMDFLHRWDIRTVLDLVCGFYFFQSTKWRIIYCAFIFLRNGVSRNLYIIIEWLFEEGIEELPGGAEVEVAVQETQCC